MSEIELEIVESGIPIVENKEKSKKPRKKTPGMIKKEAAKAALEMIDRKVVIKKKLNQEMEKIKLEMSEELMKKKYDLEKIIEMDAKLEKISRIKEVVALRF